MGIARFASCIYVTLCKTTSDVDIMHNYRHRIVFKALGGAYRYSVWRTFQIQQNSPLHK